MSQETHDIFHLIVWIDHAVARLYAAKRDRAEEIATVRAPDSGLGHVHHKAGTRGSGHNHPSPVFLKQVTTALAQAHEILIVGPSDAKFALEKYLKTIAPLLGARIVGVEPMERAGQAELHAFASLFFRQADRMRNPAL
jgi:hypothetical protein